MVTARSEELRALAQRLAGAFPPEAVEVVAGWQAGLSGYPARRT